MKKVLIVCATGVATSTMVRMRVEEFLAERGIRAEFSQARVGELAADRVDADLIVATTGMPPEFSEVTTVINGVPFLTRIGEDEALERIARTLTDAGS